MKSLLALPAALFVAACAGIAPMAVPDQLAPPAGERLALMAAARGVQIYECRAGKEAGSAPQWVFVAPEAELIDARGRPAGTHGAGPYWQAADGSRVIGKVSARADAPTADAIPWLLLSTASTGKPGVFGSVSSIQRINTVGGLAPAAGCNAETLGRQARVGYRADYRFFSAATR